MLCYNDFKYIIKSILGEQKMNETELAYTEVDALARQQQYVEQGKKKNNGMTR